MVAGLDLLSHLTALVIPNYAAALGIAADQELQGHLVRYAINRLRDLLIQPLL